MPNEVIGRHKAMSAQELLLLLNTGLRVTHEAEGGRVAIFTPNLAPHEAINLLFECSQVPGEFIVWRKMTTGRSA